MKSIITYLFLLVFSFCFSQANAQNNSSSESKMAMKEFVRSCTYGVLAGTLVGAATLAFTEQPGQNINRVARGASIGLYAGILLGLYVIYIVPSQMNEELDMDPNLLPPEEANFRWGVFPIIGQNIGNNHFEGMGLSFDLSF